MHQQPLMMGVLQAIRTLGEDVQDLKMAAYKFWEGPAEWKYVAAAMVMRKSYGEACATARGTGKRVGAVKNWLMAAMYVTYLADEEVAPEKKEEMRQLMGRFLVNADGQVDVANFDKIAHTVTHIEVTKAKYASYLTISVTGETGERVLQLLEDVWARQGKRQLDPPPPKPILKELRETERRARAAMKGGGKGS